MSKAKLKWSFNRGNTNTGSPSASPSSPTGGGPSPFGNNNINGGLGIGSPTFSPTKEGGFLSPGDEDGLGGSGGADGQPQSPGGIAWTNGNYMGGAGGDGVMVNGKPKRADGMMGPVEENLFGLENFGNTCYCNSVLQALYYCPPFRALILQVPNNTPPVIPLGPTPEFIAQWRAAHPEGVPGEQGESGLNGSNGKASNGAESGKVEKDGGGKRGFMGMGGRKGSSNILATISAGGSAQGAGLGAAPSAAAASTAIANGFTPGGGLGARVFQTTPGGLVPLPAQSTAPVAPLPTMLSAVQSLFEYISTSPSHPPPPPKVVPVGSNTIAGPLLSSPHGPTNAAIRGGGPHGAGTLGKGVAKPDELVRTIRQENELFRSNMHQDAHEFLGWLLNKIAEDVEELEKSMGEDGQGQQGAAKKKRTTYNHGKQGKTFIHSLFEGTLTNETRCLTCETTSSRDESFLDLSIDIEQNSSVTACLRQFSASEMLCQKNKFFCDTCSGLQEAEKRMKVKKLPNVLALHLKRFKYMEELGRYTKLSYRVTFPLQLRLFNTSDDIVNPDRLYELFAVVVHIGIGPHHGHYVALVKHNDRWVLCDDENMEPIEENDLQRYFGDFPAGSGYVLFYQAVDLDVAALGLKVKTPTNMAAPLFPQATPVAREAVLVPVTEPEPATPLFSTGVELLNEEPAAMHDSESVFSPKLQVAAALADYQASLGKNAMSPLTTPLAQSPPMRGSFSSSSNGRDGFIQPGSMGRTNSTNGGFIQPSPHQNSQARDIPVPKPEKKDSSGNRFSGFFGKDKESENKSKRSSVYGANGNGTSPGMPSVQRTNSSLSPSNVATLDKHPTPPTFASPSPGNDTYPIPPRGVPPASPSLRDTPNTMSSSMVSTNSSESRSGPLAANLGPISPSLAISGAMSPTGSRPGSSSGSTGFGGFASGLKRSATGLGKGLPEKKEDGGVGSRGPSGGSLSRKLSSAGRAGLSRSSSAAFGKLGFGKKDKNKALAEREEGDGAMYDD